MYEYHQGFFFSFLSIQRAIWRIISNKPYDSTFEPGITQGRYVEAYRDMVKMSWMQSMSKLWEIKDFYIIISIREMALS